MAIQVKDLTLSVRLYDQDKIDSLLSNIGDLDDAGNPTNQSLSVMCSNENNTLNATIDSRIQNRLGPIDEILDDAINGTY